MGITGSTTVTLPIGVDIDGERVREVVIDRMTGIDDENMASKANRNNGAKAMTALLQRCIQRIGDITKSSPEALLDRKLVAGMLIPDRDFLFLAIKALDDASAIDSVLKCPKCEDELDDRVTVEDLPVYEWPDDEEPVIEFTLIDGFTDGKKTYREVKWRFLSGKQQEQIARLPQDKVMTAMISMGIVEVTNEEGEKFDRFSGEAVRRLSTRDRMFALEAIKEDTPGVDLTRKHECGSCGHEWETQVNLMGFFNSAKSQKNGSPSGKKKRKKRVRR